MSQKQTTPKNTESYNRKSNTNNKNICNECGGRTSKDSTTGEIVCRDCGLVTKTNNIDSGPEWRAFTQAEKENKSRVGSPITHSLHDKGLSTTIGKKNKDIHGNKLSKRQQNKISRLRRENKRSTTETSQDRTILNGLHEIRRIASALGIAKETIETAGLLYKKAVNKNIVYGKSIETTSAASLYAASRLCDSPRQLSQIERISQAPDKSNNQTTTIYQAYTDLKSELNLKIKPVDPHEYLNKVCNNIDIENKPPVERKARQIIEIAKEHNAHIGRDPISITAAAAYIAARLCNDRVSQPNTAQAANINKNTVKAVYKDILSTCFNLPDVSATAIDDLSINTDYNAK